jgi:hypothetical protein
MATKLAGTFIAGPPWSTQPSIPQLHWMGDYPAYMPPIQWRPNGWYSPLTAAPDIIAAGHFCINLDDTDVYWARHAQTSVTVSTFVNESLTPTIEGDIC